jgi:hypothetical protein
MPRARIAMLTLVSLCACGGDDGPQNPVRDEYESWIKVEPEGAVCGNNSQYKFFANFSETSDDLVVVFEPGGACWDYESCSGAAGIRGAANPDGIPDDHFELASFISPFLQRFDETSPTRDWNMVYVPYCTGDVHTGNNVITYEDPAGEAAPLTFHHAGHANMEKVVEWIDGNFTRVPHMLVTGCSAGGAGSITNYYFLRKGIAAVDQGFMLDDSGPIFPSGGYSQPLHDKVRESWNTDSILVDLPSSFDPEDFGTINTALAAEFPDDRLATTYFRRDMNFSLYSYERFYDWPPKEEILRMWDEDTQLLVDMYDRTDNLYYYIPYWRELNDSHCTTLISFPGSEIEDHQMTLDAWVADFLDESRVPQSAMEAPVPGEDEDPPPE